MNRINSQGNYDGACFLYSIANAYAALTGKNLSQRVWDEAVAEMPFLAQFMTAAEGTRLYNDSVPLYIFSINRLLNGYRKKRFQIDSMPNLRDGAELLASISGNSVVILNIRSEHWVCAVDHTTAGAKLFLACSAQLFEKRSKYEEKTGPTFGRAYNRELLLSSGRIGWLHPGSAIRVSRLPT